MTETTLQDTILILPGADPTFENDSGHKPVAYANTLKTRELLKSAESKVAVADPGFPRRGGANPRGGGANILFDQFFPKTA